jgi:hypothetical protein
MACIGAGLAVVGLWVVGVSLNFGTFMPDIFDGEWGVAYTNQVIQPLLTFIHHPVVNKVLFLLGWGLLGLVAYMLIESGTSTFKNWRQAQKYVQVPEYGVIVHPDRRTFVAVLAWRLLVLALVFLMLNAAVPTLVRNMQQLVPLVVDSKLPLSDSIPRLALSAGAWALLAHGLVVVLRWLLLRVRVFQ